MRSVWILLLVAVAVVIGVLVLRTPEPELKPARTGDREKVKLEPIGFEELDRAVRSHKGNPVLVEFWATWCPPCRADFPKFVALQERFSERGLVCISVSLEKDPARDREEALAFLRDQRAAFTNFLWSERTQKGVDGLESRFGYPGAIPYAALFGRDGERIPPPEGPAFSKFDLIVAIESELAKPQQLPR
jgi:thiol-disulfide isomerase/thioredoxin